MAGLRNAVAAIVTAGSVAGGANALLPAGQAATPEQIALSDRLGALRSLAESGPKIVIASPQAALERTIPSDLLLESFITIRSGETGRTKLLILSGDSAILLKRLEAFLD